jgi:radical SAM protein (TIGR01212 family)
MESSHNGAFDTRRTNDLGPLLRRRYGRPARKLIILLGTTCPHRTGTGAGGCIFCAEGVSPPPPPVREQVTQGLARLGPGVAAVAYLRDHTATLLPAERLARVLDELRRAPRVVAVAIGTRPDCLPRPIVDLLARHAAEIDLWVELGLQTANDRTLELIRRGHDVRCFVAAVEQLHRRGIRVCAHVILGLPTPGRRGAIGTETVDDAVATARLIAATGVEAVKLHNCHVLADTPLAELHRRGRYDPPDLAGYIDRLIPFLEHLPPTVEIHRLVGEAREPELLAPAFTGDKAAALAAIRAELAARDTYQGRRAGR